MSSKLNNNIKTIRLNVLPKDSSTRSIEAYDQEKMIVNHHSIDLSLHSRSPPPDLSTFKEDGTNQEKINILKSKELEQINSNIPKTSSKCETHDQKIVHEKSILSLSMPLLSQAASICPKPLNESFTTPLPPIFQRYKFDNSFKFIIISIME